MTIGELHRLAEAWRTKAVLMRDRFRNTTSAQSAADAALGIETCAEDLERWLAADSPLDAAGAPMKGPNETVAKQPAQQAPAQTAGGAVAMVSKGA